jgi:hypothetical protein
MVQLLEKQQEDPKHTCMFLLLTKINYRNFYTSTQDTVTCAVIYDKEWENQSSSTNFKTNKQLRV